MKKIVFGLLILLGAGTLSAEQNQLPLPRFATLRSDEVNMRVGPGPEYPVVWTLKRKGMPVEIIGEFGTWRKIREADGDEGWVHQNMLTGKRTVLVKGETQPLFRKASLDGKQVAHVQPGVSGKVLECEEGWCRVQMGDEEISIKGWMKREALWGVYPTDQGKLK